MHLIAEEHGIQPEQCAFVGDGMNDVNLANAVGMSIAFNAQRELIAVATASIVQAPGAVDFGAVRSELARLFRERAKGEPLSPS